MPQGFYTRRSAKNLANGRTDRQSGSEYLRGHFILDPDTFNRIRRMALAADVSFSEMLRTIIVWGLEDVDDD